jgi:uncharacterized protein (TIGR02118 family)
MKPLGLLGSEVVRSLPGPGGEEAPFQIFTHLYYDKIETFMATLQLPAMAELAADVPNFYKGGQPMLFAGTIVHQG